jgi:uncharacterized membrane-anchored protein YjiN (DUF445 family)
MSLDYASHVFFTAVQDAVSSDHPPRKRLEQLCSASLDKLRGDEDLREDISARISRVRESRGRLVELSEGEVKALLKEIISIYDAIAAQLYATGRTKAVTGS